MGKHLRPLSFFLCAMALSGTGAPATPVADDSSPHGALLEAPFSRKGADSCLACHDDPITVAVFRNVHGNPAHPDSPFGPGQLQCEACHGPGGAHAGRIRRGAERPELIRFSPNAATPVAVKNDQCATCHTADVDVGWAAGHGHHDIACSDCHSSHEPSDSVLTVAGQPGVCFKCHSEQRSAAQKPFAHPLSEQKMHCSACHSIHDADGERLLTRPTLNQTCYQCHAQMRGPHLWEHAPVSEDCSLCHDVHGSNHPGMLIQRGPFLCQSCHSESGHPSLANDADGLPSGTPSRFLLGSNCMNCHSQIHGSNHPSGSRLMR